MNPRELVDHIRSGPAELRLDKLLLNRFVFAVERVLIRVISTSFLKPCDPMRRFELHRVGITEN
jgi:hypothetical protein